MSGTRGHFFIALALIAIFQCSAAYATFQYYGTLNGSNATVAIPQNLSRPVGLAWMDGSLYAADENATFLFVFDSHGIFNRRVGGAGALDGMLQKPKKLLAWDGIVYIADSGASTVFKHDPKMKTIEEFVPKTREGKMPIAVGLDNGSFYAIDAVSNQVFEYGFSNQQLKNTRLSEGSGNSQIKGGADIAVAGGRIFVSDKYNDRILVFNRNWSYNDTWGRGRGNVTLSEPEGLDYYNGRLYVADSLNNRMVVFGSDGYPIEILGEGQGRGKYNFNRTVDVVAANGTLYVADFYNSRIMMYRISVDGMSAQFKGDVAATNASIASIENARKLLSQAGVEPAPFDAPKRLDAAVAKYMAGEIGAASDLIAALDSDLREINISIVLNLRLKLQARIDAAKARMDTVGTAKLSSDLEDMRNSVRNRIIDTQVKIDDAQWQQASESLGKIESGLDSIEKSAAAAKVTPPPNPVATVSGGEQPAGALAAYGETLKLRIGKIKEAQAKENQSNDYSATEGLIDAGIALAKGGATKEANISLSNAQAQVAKAEKEWEGQLISAGNSSATLVNAAKAIEDASKWEAFGIDLAGAKEKLENARKYAYTDPAKANSLANEAASLAIAEGERGRNRGLAAGWLGAAMIGIMGIAAGVYWAYRKRKRSI